MLPFLKKTLLSDNSASNRNFLSKSIKGTEGAGQSGEGKRGGGEWEEGTASRTKERIWKERVAAASNSEPQHRRPMSVPMVLLPSKGSLPKAHKSQYNGSSFWEKKELHCEVDQQEDRKQGSQICLPDPGIKVKFKGLEEFQTWKLTSLESVHVNYWCCWKTDFSYWRTSRFIKVSGGKCLFFEFHRLKILGPGSPWRHEFLSCTRSAVSVK